MSGPMVSATAGWGMGHRVGFVGSACAVCPVTLPIFLGHPFTGWMWLALPYVSINPREVNVKAILIMKVQFLLPRRVLRSAFSGLCRARMSLLLTRSLVGVIELNFQDHQLSCIQWVVTITVVHIYYVYNNGSPYSLLQSMEACSFRSVHQSVMSLELSW